ncbi:MAG: hypothetical protein Q9191_001465 [Dirinaria sp. TL-2023a]
MGAISWYSEPMKHCDDRRDLLFQGEVLGGSSRINGMVFTRGSAADYDAWSSMGHPEWGFDEVLPYFVKAETSIGRPKSNYRGDSAMGFGPIEDTNSPDAFSDGIATHDLTVDKNKQRVSTLEAYLPRATVLEREKNLTICTGVIATHIEFSDDRTQRCAQRVKFQYAQSVSEKTFSVTVNKEVIISSGAVGSPQVLMLRFGVPFFSD